MNLKETSRQVVMVSIPVNLKIQPGLGLDPLLEGVLDLPRLPLRFFQLQLAQVDQAFQVFHLSR